MTPISPSSNLRVDLSTRHARLRQRESGRDPTWFLGTATYLMQAMRPDEVADYAVDNGVRPVSEVAAEILRLVG
jgi:hypothetical protein